MPTIENETENIIIRTTKGRNVWTCYHNIRSGKFLPKLVCEFVQVALNESGILNTISCRVAASIYNGFFHKLIPIHMLHSAASMIVED